MKIRSTAANKQAQKDITTQLLRFQASIKSPHHDPLTIQKIQIVSKKLELVRPFETSFGRFTHMTKLYVITTFKTNTGKIITGIGECTPLPYPWYDGESDATVKTILTKYILPVVQANRIVVCKVDDLLQLYGKIVGNPIAKAGVEASYWDAVSKFLKTPVNVLWGGSRREVPTGTSVGLETTIQDVLEKVTIGIEQGVKRIKIKIAPGRDVEYVKAIRNMYPEIGLQVDGNAAYDLQNQNHVAMLQALDKFNLILIEQPGPNDDRYYHMLLSKQLKTPICLDESILHTRHAIEAIAMWEKEQMLEKLIINIKPPRVGGFWEAVKMAKVCGLVGVSTWCGGMLESALGKTANVHFSSLPEVNLPGDHIAQGPYFVRDIAKPLKNNNGFLTVPNTYGWGISENV